METLITFRTISGSLDCEQLMKRAGISCVVDIVPRELRTSCVYAIRTGGQTPEEAAAFCRENSVQFAKIFRRSEADGAETWMLVLTA